MTERERFIEIVAGRPVDWVPIFGFTGAPGVSAGCMRTTWERLRATGMPDVGGCWELDGRTPDLEGWHRYWGTTGPLTVDAFPGEQSPGIRSQRHVEGGFEIIEYETGARTRQVLDNDITYSMPDFQVHHVRDRRSWRSFRDRITPGAPWSRAHLTAVASGLTERTRPLAVNVGSTWGFIREVMGPEAAAMVLYDDPVLAAEMIEWQDWRRRTYLFPLVDALRPEILQVDEDYCYKGGMLIGPRHFALYSAPSYREIAGVARDCGVSMLAVDSDGNVMEYVPLIAACGVNALFPLEAKAGNDLARLRAANPEFVLMGGLEKEVLNAGNEAAIRPEIMGKVPSLLAEGRYFPNGDHGIQPLVAFPSLCRFMTLLHGVAGNPCGEYPRADPG